MGRTKYIATALAAATAVALLPGGATAATATKKAKKFRCGLELIAQGKPNPSGSPLRLRPACPAPFGKGVQYNTYTVTPSSPTSGSHRRQVQELLQRLHRARYVRVDVLRHEPGERHIHRNCDLHRRNLRVHARQGHRHRCLHDDRRRRPQVMRRQLEADRGVTAVAHKIKLYMFTGSGPSMTARLMLEHKDLEYSEVHMTVGPHAFSLLGRGFVTMAGAGAEDRRPARAGIAPGSRAHSTSSCPSRSPRFAADPKLRPRGHRGGALGRGAAGRGAAPRPRRGAA